MIKRFLFLLLILSTGYSLMAVPNADTIANDSLKHWKFTSLNMVSINQNAFLNWSSGGESSLSGKVSTEYDLVYKKRRFIFDHGGKLAFGLVGYSDKRIEKTDDIIDLMWAISHETTSKWNLTSVLTFKSQFADGFKYPDDSTLISTFMAPGYGNISVGFNYKPNEKFHIYLSPAAGKLTFVMNQELADKGSFGVKKAVIDTANNIIKNGENMLAEMGVKLFTTYKHKIMKNVDLRSTLNLYNNYTDHVKSNRWNIDIDWDTRIVFTINKIFSSVLFFHLKYDHNTKIPSYETIDGEKIMVSNSPKLQMKESFGLSFSYKI